MYVGRKKTNGLGELKKGRLLVTEEEKMKAFIESHDNSLGGHFGKNSTIDKIALNYYWKGMIRDVSHWVCCMYT